MQSVSTIGLDLAKSVFQVHGVDAAGQVVMRRQLRRRHVLSFFQNLPPCQSRMTPSRHRLSVGVYRSHDRMLCSTPLDPSAAP